MGQAVAVQSKYTGLAKRCRNADQGRRLLSIVAVVDGASRAPRGEARRHGPAPAAIAAGL
jgi:hypothetical protein